MTAMNLLLAIAMYAALLVAFAVFLFWNLLRTTPEEAAKNQEAYENFRQAVGNLRATILKEASKFLEPPLRVLNRLIR